MKTVTEREMTATGRIHYLPCYKDTDLETKALEISLGLSVLWEAVSDSLPYPNPQVWKANK